MPECDDITAAFLAEHPECLAGCRYLALTPDGPPELCFDANTLKAFVAWGDAHGLFARRELIPALLCWVTQWEHGEHDG